MVKMKHLIAALLLLAHHSPMRQIQPRRLQPRRGKQKPRKKLRRRTMMGQLKLSWLLMNQTQQTGIICWAMPNVRSLHRI